jgi:hypothetical protein
MLLLVTGDGETETGNNSEISRQINLIYVCYPWEPFPEA